MTWGEGLPAIRRAAQNGSASAIARLNSQPELSPWLNEVWAAFSKLSSCRSVGMGVGSIPWTAINDYAIRYGIAGDEFEEFEHHIREMDELYLKTSREKQKAQS